MAETRKASDLMVRALEEEGVEYIFGLPGEENLDLLDSLKDSSIKLILTRHEQGAGFMAATYGRLTGRAGVCMATLGPGATNLVTPAAYASLGAFPMLLITGQKPIKKSKQGRFQIVDIVRMMEPLTRWAVQIVHGNTIPARVREAFRLAEQERQGPVHLELPEDIAAEETNVRPFPRPERAGQLGNAPDHEALDTAVRMIRQAKHPLVLIGAGANRHDVSTALERFIDTTKLPFFTTQMGKGVIDERHALCLGTAALSDNDYVHCAIDRADLILNVGHDVIEKPPFFMEHGGKQVVHINYLPAEIDEVYFPQMEVVGDISDALDGLADRLKVPVPSHDLAYFKRVKGHIDEHLAEGADDPRFPLAPQRIVADVRKVMPSKGVIALDNGMYKIWFARNYPAHQRNTVLLDNALATMGAGLPSAMTVAMLHPDRPVVCICGDGGFLMNAQELETARRLGLNLVALVLRDDAYGMIRWKQEGMGLPDWGLEFGNPDFVQLAEAYGAQGHRITATEDFAGVLAGALEQGGVHLIEVPIDYSENKRVLIDELAAKVCLI